jgi:hypothetical protein
MQPPDGARGRVAAPLEPLYNGAMIPPPDRA